MKVSLLQQMILVHYGIWNIDTFTYLAFTFIYLIYENLKISFAKCFSMPSLKYSL